MRRVLASLKGFWRPDQTSDGLIDEGLFKAYWRAYGGARALITSRYLWAACLIALVVSPLWLNGLVGESHAAGPNYAVAILPNLLGFSIGAIAIVLAFPSNKLLSILTKDGDGDSYYMDSAARLVHFVVVQVTALICTLVALAYPHSAFNFISVFMLIYALLSAASAGMSIFGIAKIYNAAGAPSNDGHQQ